MAILLGNSLEFLGMQALDLVFHSSVNASPPTAYSDGQAWFQTDRYTMSIRSNSAWTPVVFGPTSSTTTNIPQWGNTYGSALTNGLSLQTTVRVSGSALDTALATEQAVREAIDAALASDVSFMGGYDASTNTPNLDATPIAIAAGDMYYVSVAGTFFSTPLDSGDVIIANQNSPTLESHWTIIQKNLPSLIPVANGGTGLGTLTQYGIMIGAGTNTVQFVGADATANKYLKNVSASANPVWSTSTFAEATTAGAIMRASAANAWAQSTITIVDAFASGGIPHASSANTLTNLAISSTVGVLLRSTGSLPAWGAVAYPNSAAIGDIPYASTTANIAMLASVAVGSYLRSAGVTTAPVWSTLKLANSLVQWGMLYAATADNLTSTIAAATVTGSFLRGTASGAPAWGAVAYPNSAAVGDLLYASTTTAISGLAAVAAGSYLRSAGTSTAPVWSTLILPNASTRGDLLRGATTANNVTVLALGTAGKLLRSDGSDPTWSTVTMPNTITALSIFVANAAHTLVELTLTANQSIRMNSSGTAWEAYTPSAGSHTFAGATHTDVTLTSLTTNDILKWNGSAWVNVPIPASGGSHTLLGTSTHSDSTNTTVVRGMMIVGNSTPAWTGLAITVSGVTSPGYSGYVLASNATDVVWKKQKYIEKLATSATSYNIVHNLGTRRVMVVCQDATNNQNILVDWACTSGSENNSITVTFGVAPTLNTRIITVFGINNETVLDTSNT